MAQIVVRNIPDRIMHGLRELAEGRGVSTEQAVRLLIADAVDQADRLERFRALARSARDDLAARTGSFADSTADIREDRDGR